MVIKKKTTKSAQDRKVVKKSALGGKVAKKTSAAKIINLKVGQLAPDFTLPSTDGVNVKLSSLRGKKVVLYFYPKDMTTGCTIEAHEFSAVAKQFAKAGALVFGLSPDSVESHHKFIKKDNITFPLLADEGHKVALKYGVWVKKSMYGREYMGIERATFVVSEEGKLSQVYRKVSAPGHAVCVLNDLS